MPRTIITDELWSRLVTVLRAVGVRYSPTLRPHVEGIFWRTRVGGPWRDVPRKFGPYSSVYNLFNRWSKSGKLDSIFEAVRRDPDLEFAFIDGSIVRAHQHSAGARQGENTAIGRSRGGLSTKIHMVADAHGNPYHVVISEGQRHDAVFAQSLVDATPAEHFVGDKGYDSNLLRQHIRERGSIPVIPNKATTKTPNPDMDDEIYKWRHLVENLFARLKHFRAIATRYDKLARNYLGTIKLGSIFCWLRLT